MEGGKAQCLVWTNSITTIVTATFRFNSDGISLSHSLPSLSISLSVSASNADASRNLLETVMLAGAVKEKGKDKRIMTPLPVTTSLRLESF